MSRDFEFKQLLRAYRSGIITQDAFEEEMTQLERGSAPASNGGPGFQAFGRTYKSERDAIISFLDKVRAGEANGGEAFARWAAVCKTDCIRSGLRIVAERESYHARVFEQRVLELGGDKRASINGEGRQIGDYLANPDVTDVRKTASFRVAGWRSQGRGQADPGIRGADQGRHRNQRSAQAVLGGRAFNCDLASGVLRGAERH